MNKKRVLITGGNKGIGLAVSRAMLELGHEVIMLNIHMTTILLKQEMLL
jgi:NAD(P)-dependent dehydrogenase (short-subunit alcohol dehydrogenase family)